MSNIKLEENDSKLIQEAALLIKKGLDNKENPSSLRLILVEIQALRFNIGQSLAEYRALVRDTARKKYVELKDSGMSPSASHRDTEMDESVVQYKNARDYIEIAYNTISDFVNINQTSLKIATEESKNNL